MKGRGSWHALSLQSFPSSQAWASKYSKQLSLLISPHTLVPYPSHTISPISHWFLHVAQIPLLQVKVSSQSSLRVHPSFTGQGSQKGPPQSIPVSSLLFIVSLQCAGTPPVNVSKLIIVSSSSKFWVETHFIS